MHATPPPKQGSETQHVLVTDATAASHTMPIVLSLCRATAHTDSSQEFVPALLGNKGLVDPLLIALQLLESFLG